MSNRPPAATNTAAGSSVKGNESSSLRKKSLSPSSTNPITLSKHSWPAARRDEVKPSHSVQRAATFGAPHPPLSERESIFAEHYIPSQNEQTTSPTHDGVGAFGQGPASKPLSKSGLGGLAVQPQSSKISSSPSGTSPLGKDTSSTKYTSDNTATNAPSSPNSTKPTTQTVRRVASDSQSFLSRSRPSRSSTNMAIAKQESEIPIPEHSQKSILSGISDVAVEDELDNKERPSRPSSMKHALQGNRTERSASRGRTQVEKSIEVTLPRTDQVTNVRSRKSSHYMGLFRQDVAPSDADLHVPKLSQDKDHRSDYAASGSPTSSPTADDTASRYSPALTGTTSSTGASQYDVSNRGPHSGHRLPGTTSISSPSSVSPGSAPSRESRPTSPLREGHDPYFRSHDEAKQKVLNQIRDRQSQKLKQLDSREAQLVQEKLLEDLEKTANATHSKAHFILPRGVDGSEKEEYMSKVEYKPHAGRAPEDLEQLDEQDLKKLEGELRDKVPETDGSRTSQEVKRSAGDALPSEHIDISIESKHEKRIFHGSYQPPEEADEERSSGSMILPTIDEMPDADLKTLSASETEPESGDEDGQTSQTDDGETTPTATNDRRLSIKAQDKSNAPKLKGSVVLDAYKHQVGGHSMMFRLARRAVCKKLNNRENEFYENVELRHPEILRFLPKYIGVLNITFVEKPGQEDPNEVENLGDPTESERKNPRQFVESVPLQDKSNGSSPKKNENLQVPSQPRQVSHSSKEDAQGTPYMLLAQNRHILPSHMLDNLPERPRSAGPLNGRRPSSQVERSHLISEVVPSSAQESRSSSRPPIEHSPLSWGTTTVNKELLEKVMRAILQGQPQIHQHHRHRRPVPAHSTIPRTKDPASRKRNNVSVSSFSDNTRKDWDSNVGQGDESSGQYGTLLPDLAPPEMYSSSASVWEDMSQLEKIRTTASISSNGSAGSGKMSIKRRHSGVALRRRRNSMSDNSGGDLKLYDDDKYSADAEDEVFSMDDEKNQRRASEAPETGAASTSQKYDKLSAFPAPVQQRERESDDKVLESHALQRSNSVGPEPLPLNPKDARSDVPDGRLEYYIVLEDLTVGMGRPCVLDLKMGTRQYGVEATAQKRKSQRAKCKCTTSQQLGVRICGMQTFDARKNETKYQDKYIGRDIRAGADFRQALTRFLCDGVNYGSIAKHIPVILEKLSKLEDIVRKLPGYRFYASSLLLYYDAEPLQSTKGKEAAEKYAVSKAEGEEADKQAAANGTFSSNEHIGRVTHVDGQETAEPPDQEKPESKTVTKKPDDQRVSAKTRKEFKFEAPPIEVKMLDFANCVQAEDELPPGTTFPPQHPDDVDRGYLRGLRTLKVYFERILSDYQEDKGIFHDRGESEGLHNQHRHDQAHGQGLEGDEKEEKETVWWGDDEGEIST